MPRRRSSRVALGCFVAVAAVDLVAELFGWQPIALVCRILLMPLLAWCCWTAAVRRTRLVILVLIALGFSWFGDLSAPVLIKIGFFLIAQIVYIVAFRPYWRRSLIARPPLLIAYGIALVALIGVVATAAGTLAGPVAVYGASLAVMAVLATGVSRLTGLGGALFLVSDIVLAVELFVAPGAIPYALFVNMALYLPAQLMITLGVLERVSAEVEPMVADPGSVTIMQTRTLGPFTVSAIGLGGMPMSMNSDNVLPSEADAFATIHAALDAGVTFIDTADIYAPSWDTMGHNEVLVGKALRAYGGSLDGVVVGTKGGITRGEGETWGRDGSLAYLRTAVEKSLRNLGVEQIDLYQWHRPDRWQVYGEVIGHFKTLQDEGLIKAIGISNANVEEIEIAVDVLGEGGLASVQNEFSPRFRCSTDTLELCGEHGVAFLPWSPLGGTGGGAREVGDRFAAFGAIAADHGVSPQQVVLAWELALGEHVIPIPGARRPASITDSAQATHLVLSSEEIERCTATPGTH